jgi:hypothetical protein
MRKWKIEIKNQILNIAAYLSKIRNDYPLEVAIIAFSDFC